MVGREDYIKKKKKKKRNTGRSQLTLSLNPPFLYDGSRSFLTSTAIHDCTPR